MHRMFSARFFLDHGWSCGRSGGLLHDQRIDLAGMRPQHPEAGAVPGNALPACDFRIKVSWLLSLLLIVACSHSVRAETAIDATAPSAVESTDATSGTGSASSTTTDSADASSTTDSESAQAPVFILQNKPRWEFGFGGGYFNGFDYPASLDPNRRSLVLPYFIYRSPRVRFGGGNVRAVALESPRVKLDIAVGASLNASSEGNRARAGLPDLDFIFGVGPQLAVRLLDTDRFSLGRASVNLNINAQALASTDFAGVRAQGFVLRSSLRFSLRNVAQRPVNLFVSATTTLADERLQDYLYEVPAQFATESRAAYDARGGYLGTTLSLGMSLRPSRPLRIFLALQSGFFGGAANADSPLYETSQSTGFAVGFAWELLRSRDFIEVLDTE